MVRAMVTRETNGSYMVTMGDAVMPLNHQKIVNVPASATAASSGTGNALEVAKATWKATIEKIKTDVNAAIDMRGARALTKSLSAAKTQIDSAIDSYQTNQNKVVEEKIAVAEEKKAVDSEITKVFTRLKKKGGRRTRRKHTIYPRRKHTHRK